MLELRWFLPGPAPQAVVQWWDKRHPHHSSESRTDQYLITTADDIGLKVRESRLELKYRIGSFAVPWGYIEHWEKTAWGPMRPLQDGRLLAVAKVRRQASTGRVLMELVEIRIESDRWWSLCIEAWSESPVVRAVESMMVDYPGPALQPEASFGYPHFMNHRLELHA